MEALQKILRELVEKLFGIETDPVVMMAPEETGADYATNVAMVLAKDLHQSPIQIAESLKEAYLQDKAGGFEVEVAKPGFLNFRLADMELMRMVIEGADSKQKYSSGEYFGKVVVTEFSDPNPFKVLHVGHLYTSIVGDSISRLLELAGAKVYRANFGGDVGLHVAKTIWAVLKNNYSSGEIKIDDIAKCYVEGTQAYEEDEVAKTEIVRLNKIIYRLAELGKERALERLELENLAEEFETSTAEMARVVEIYWRGRELSYEYFEDFYAKIGVKFDKYYPESSVAGRGLSEVREHVGSVYEESDGAVVYRGEKVGLHTRVFINREGVPTYETKDVGLIFTKWDDWHFDESMVITGNEQSDYMKVVLASVYEYAPELVERTSHLTHGLVKLQGNVKMSSRKGNFLKAVDVIEMIREMLGGKEADERIVLAAIKYAFLKYKLGGDIVFDPKESVSTNGNSGVYLLYSAVRARKILQKIGQGEGLNKKFVQEELEEQGSELTDEEREFTRKLNKKIIQFGEVLKVAVLEKAPSKLCTYLYELAQEFSRFYEHVKVVGGKHEELLGQVVKAYYQVMEQGLGLLGIEIPEEM